MMIGRSAICASHSGRRTRGAGEAQEDVGAGQHVRQRARIGAAGIAGHVGRHVGLPAFIDHALDVGERHVFGAEPHRHQQIHTGQGGGPGTRGDQAQISQSLALQHQRVVHGRGHRDRCAVLVIVEDRDFHPCTQRGFDGKALRRLDVLQIDRPEGRFQRRQPRR